MQSIKETKLTLAIVDDRVDDHFLIERALSEYPNITFKSFYDGPQLIDYLLKKDHSQKSNDPLPDIVFLDVNMPGLSGYDTFKELKEHRELSHVHFVIFSNSNEFDFLRHQELGVDCFTKPQTFDKLKELLKKIIEDYLSKRNS